MAWDWWNFNNLYGVPFRAGVNTATYEHHIDFAAEHGIEYVILDEGWYKLGDLSSIVPAIDMNAIATRARERKVGLIMWVVWKTFDQQMDATFDQFEKWGVKGIKVDFMQRDDQPMVNFYERVAREAARRQHAGRLPRRLQAHRSVSHLSQRPDQRRDHRPGTQQVERRRVAGPQRHLPVHADDGGTGRLHAGRDAQRHQGGLQAGVQPPDDAGHALPPAGDVRGLREPAADAGRLAVQLPA